MVSPGHVVAASYRYDPFGNLVSKSGPLADANVYRFSSKEVHLNSGLYYFGYRFYSPNLQRWINRDPIGEGGGINLYGFVENDAVNLVDSLGLKWVWIYNENHGKPIFGSDKPQPEWVQVWVETSDDYDEAEETFCPRFKKAFDMVAGGGRGGSGKSYKGLVDAVKNLIKKCKVNNKAAKTPLQIAQGGGRHAGFLKNYEGRSPAEIQKGIASLEKQIAEHQAKIADPEKLIPNFKQLDPRQQKALLESKWPGDIQRQQEQIEILKEILGN